MPWSLIGGTVLAAVSSVSSPRCGWRVRAAPDQTAGGHRGSGPDADRVVTRIAGNIRVFPTAGVGGHGRFFGMTVTARTEFDVDAPASLIMEIPLDIDSPEVVRRRTSPPRCSRRIPTARPTGYTSSRACRVSPTDRRWHTSGPRTRAPGIWWRQAAQPAARFVHAHAHGHRDARRFRSLRSILKIKLPGLDCQTRPESCRRNREEWTRRRGQRRSATPFQPPPDRPDRFWRFSGFRDRPGTTCCGVVSFDGRPRRLRYRHRDAGRPFFALEEADHIEYQQVSLHRQCDRRTCAGLAVLWR